MMIMTTTFIPGGANVPFIAMIAGAIFGGSAWVATSAYFVGMAAIIISGIMRKKTKMFAGDPAPVSYTHLSSEEINLIKLYRLL